MLSIQNFFNFLMFWELFFGFFLVVWLEETERDKKSIWPMFIGVSSCLLLSFCIQPNSMLREFLESFVLNTPMGELTLLLFFSPIFVFLDIFAWRAFQKGKIILSWSFFMIKLTYLCYLLYLGVFFLSLYKKNFLSIDHIDQLLLNNSIFDIKLNNKSTYNILMNFKRFSEMHNYALEYDAQLINSFCYEKELVYYLKSKLIQLPDPVIPPPKSWWFW
jgi:hypothetical protein